MPPHPPTRGAARRRVLASAYACTPGLGSEPGIGWNWARQIALHHDLTLITRENNVDEVVAAAQAEGLSMEVVGHDLPPSRRFWKRGPRGAMLYAYLWQRSLAARAREVMASAGTPFDVAHHLTFASGWLPSGLAELDLPFVFGPVGEHPRLERRFMGSRASARSIGEWAKARVKDALSRHDASVARTWAAADVILSLGEQFEKRLDKAYHPRLERMLACGVASDQAVEPRGRTPEEPLRVLFAGRLVDLKGVRLALRAFACASRCAPMILEFVGEGPLRVELEQLAAELGVADRVRFRGRLDHSKTLETMEQHHVFLFPSFEGAGMVVPEAMAAGLAVVCLNTGGPGEMVAAGDGLAAPVASSVEGTVQGLASALQELAEDELLRIGLALEGHDWVLREATWESKGARLESIYDRAIEHRRGASAVPPFQHRSAA